MKRLLLLLAACGTDRFDPPPDPDPLPPAIERKGLNDLSPIAAYHGPTGAIATNGIPNIALAPLTVGGARVPTRALPSGRLPGIPAPSSVATIGGLGMPDEVTLEIEPGTLSLEGGSGVDSAFEVGGVPFGVTITGAIVDGVPIDEARTGIAITRCTIRGLSATRAAVLDLDLTGEDLNEVVLAGVPLDGRADLATGLWFTGFTAGQMVCDCESFKEVELSQCLPVALPPYDISLRVRATPPPVVMPVTHLHVAIAEQLPGGGITPLCPAGLPADAASCALAGGDFTTGTCTLADKDQDGAPGYIADGIAVDTLDAYLRAATAAAIKIAFHPRVVATLACAVENRPDVAFDFHGELGTAGLFGGPRFVGGDPVGLEQQRWFTAAFMALVNPWEQRVHVSLRHADRGPTTFGSGRPWPLELRPFQPQLDLDGDGTRELDLTTEFTEFDGTYYGNMFAGTCATPADHPDCAEVTDGELVDFIRTTDMPSISVITGDNATGGPITEDECRILIEDAGLVFDAARNYPDLWFAAGIHWCVSDPRTCGSHPVLNTVFCPFDASGYAKDFCAGDASLGYSDCAGTTRRWPEQVSVYLATDRAVRFEVPAETTCRSINRLRIAVGGCSDPAIADCDGDGIPDGCR